MAKAKAAKKATRPSPKAKARHKATSDNAERQKTTPKENPLAQGASRAADETEGTIMAQENPTPKSPPSIDQDTAGLGNMAQIRDILFGPQMRDYEKRFTRLEERAAQDMASLKEDTRNRLESLERYVKQEVEALGGRIKSEQAERTSELKEMASELKDLSEELEKKIAQLDEKQSTAERGLNQHILDQANALRDEANQKNRELQDAIDKELQEIGETKTDRAVLGELFMEMSMRMRDEFELPQAE